MCSLLVTTQNGIVTVIGTRNANARLASTLRGGKKTGKKERETEEPRETARGRESERERCTSMKINVIKELLIVISDNKNTKVCLNRTYKTVQNHPLHAILKATYI